MSDCSEIFAMLSEYLDRELTPSTCRDLEEHLRDCPECIQFVDSLRRTVDLCHKYVSSRGVEPLDAEALAQLRMAYDRALKNRRS
jgi:predicted anti-sigma-YlaC factor YlaD